VSDSGVWVNCSLKGCVAEIGSSTSNYPPYYPTDTTSCIFILEGLHHDYSSVVTWFPKNIGLAGA